MHRVSELLQTSAKCVVELVELAIQIQHEIGKDVRRDCANFVFTADNSGEVLLYRGGQRPGVRRGPGWEEACIGSKETVEAKAQLLRGT